MLLDRHNNIQVIIRPKPGQSCEFDDCDSSKIKIANREFYFDQVLAPTAVQEDVFQLVGQPLIRSALEGYNGCVFAYGQTGSGKTHTLVGLNDGVLPQSLQYLFARAPEAIIKASYLEIYNEHIYDLLAECAALQLREDPKRGTYVQDLSESVMADYNEALQLLRRGAQSRHVAATKMNSESSRSHAVFIIQYATSQLAEHYETHLSAKLNFVDLAGSERQKTSQTDGQRLKEASAINRSLSVLGSVISALVESHKGKSLHIPYRDSKLTNLLKDCLGGNSKTFMVATVAMEHVAETLSTLKFADRVKQIKTKAQVNKEYSGEELTKLRHQITVLQAEISDKNRQLDSIQPSDALQSQLLKQFEEIRQVIERINQSAVDGNLMAVENDLQDFTQRKCVVIQILKSLDFRLEQGYQVNQQFESENKLRTQLLQQEDVIYKLQKKKRELEQHIQDLQEFNTTITNQHNRSIEEQFKLKDDLIFQLKDEIDTGESARIVVQGLVSNLQARLVEADKRIDELQMEGLQRKEVINNEVNDTIREQNCTIVKLNEINEQLRSQFEHVHKVIELNQQQFNEENMALKEHLTTQEKLVKQLNTQILQLQTENQCIGKLNEHKREWEQIRLRHTETIQTLEQQLQESGATQECLREELQRLEQQIQALEIQEDSLNEENILYRNTIVQFQQQLNEYEQQFQQLRSTYNINCVSDICAEFDRRLNKIIKSKQKAQQDLLTIKSEYQIHGKQVNLKEQTISDLSTELQQLQRVHSGCRMEIDMLNSERAQRESLHQKKINELKFECEKLRSARISIKAEQTNLENQKKEVEEFLYQIERKLQEYIIQTFRKNRVMSQEQQLLYLKTTQARQTKQVIIDSLIEIVIVIYHVIIQLDSVDRQFMNFSQLRNK